MAATTRPAKKTARKRATPPREQVTGRLAPAGDVIDLDAEPQTLGDETVTLFRLGGVEYGIPAHPSAAVALKALDVLREQGDIIGGAWMLRELLGEEGYDALREWDGLTPALLNQIVDKATKITFGALEAGGIGGQSGPLGRG